MNRTLIPRRASSAPLQRISRRGLITSGVLAGVLAATGVPVYAQRRQGVLRIALPGRFDGWGVAGQDLVQRVLGTGTVFETLTDITASGELVGELAAGWQAAEGGRIWTLTLRPGVLFHDGRPVTAQDVRDSLLRHRNQRSPLEWFARNLSTLQAVNDVTLRLTLQHPDPDLPLILADPHLMIAPGGAVEAGIGSGPYQTGDDPLHLTRLARHWRDGQAGWFDGVALILTDDPGAALAAGLADVAPLPVPGLPQVTVAASASLLLTAPPGFASALAQPGRSDRLPGIEATHIPTPPQFTLTHAPGLSHAGTVGGLAPLDNGRIALRWWFA